MLLPYRDDNPTVLTPYVTVGLIGACVAVWVVAQGMGAETRLAESVCALGLVPGDLVHRLPPGSSFDIGGGTSCQVGAGWQRLSTYCRT